MAHEALTRILRYLYRSAVLPNALELTDGQLLDRFVSHHEDAAFNELIQRHGGVVWGVCQRS